MTYRIEITAPTLAELGGKLAAAASQFMAASASSREITIRIPAVTTVAAAPAPTPTIDVVPEPEPVPVPEPVSEPAPVNVLVSRPYDYATEVAPRVLQLVGKRGRDGAKAVLATLGVTSASKLHPSRYGELLIAIDAALGEK